MKRASVVHVELTVTYTPANPAHVEAVFEAVQEGLVGSVGVADADLAANLQASSLTFSMYLRDPEDQGEALRRTISVARAALQTAGENTPGWDFDNDYEFVSTEVDGARFAIA